ncbi:uncharacterized protein LOC119613670 [Lucilia sericata]|uniref:uncharacterized protein LOC119613670 n=1 Tax=Lucilia sericata TaxID=13632 RepID=UPI0018A80D26|nr:uncharacterized protein LOC119613670 [Lucilia sericata]
MFLGKMVKDFLDSIKNSNQPQTMEKSQEKPPRTNSTNYKTSRKTKQSHIKSSLNVDDITDSQLPQTSTGNRKSKDNNKPLIPTKVKSGSWKRSDKSIAPFNTLTNKKHKNLRKKSPNWLKFPNGKGKILETTALASGKEPTSACRPGTLYSDVLFGAGCSNLVKIKNVTPRSGKQTETAQKKLTKALFKFNGSHQEMETSDDSEIEVKRNLFPALQKVNKMVTPLLINTPDTPNSITKDDLATTSFKNCNKNLGTEDVKDAVILSDFKDLCLTNNEISYGNYLEGCAQHLNGKVELEAGPSSSTCPLDRQFLVSSITNIPKWNFITAETGAEAFPKFMCQFDDENYLKAEKMAWLGLKLALGNNSSYDKAKF